MENFDKRDFLSDKTRTDLPNEKKVKEKFLSIKWKVIITTSLFLTLVFAVNTVITINKVKKDFYIKNSKIIKDSNKSLKDIMNSEFQVLQGYANFLTLDTKYTEDTKKGNYKDVKNIIKRYRWQLEVNYDVSSIFVYKNTKEMVKLGGEKPPLKFINSVYKKEASAWTIKCDKRCMLYVAIPYVSQDNSNNMNLIVISKTLANSLLKFKNKMGYDIALMREGNFNGEIYFKKWGVSVSYLTEEKKINNLETLKKIEKKYSLSNLRENGRGVAKIDDKYKEIDIFNVPKLNDDNAYFIAFKDVTKQKMEEFNIILNNLIFGFIALFFIEFILIAIMWLPLRSIRDLTFVLPLMARSDYKTARDKIKNTLQYSEQGFKLFYDESDALNITALKVCDQLDEYSNELKNRNEELGFLAYNDTLTDLYNRRKFQEELERQIKIAKRSDSSGAVLFFDLDNFKDVNDGSGHHVGDELLKKVAQKTKNICRKNDVVARIGGDEFAIILSNIEESDAVAVAEKICYGISNIEINGKSMLHKASASIGLAIFPDVGEDVEEVIYYADIAMYKAKELGRNNVYIFKENDKEMSSQISERIYWAEKAKEEVNSAFLKVVCQPIYDYKNENISHYEALLRVKNSEGGFISPYNYIMAAEKSGNIYKVDKWMLNEVSKSIAIMQKNGVSKKISVNLSALSFSNKDLMENIEDIFVDNDINPNSIIFEITETAALKNIYETIKTMNEIKKLGCRFALDDFGVGFSSFYNLKKLPIDYVKIDGSFIKNIKNDQGDQILVKALVNIAKEYGELTVAEFVEDEETLNILKNLGVDYAQGYYISKPKDIDVILKEEVENSKKS